MGTFGGIVNAATRSLSSYSEALDVIQTNIANAATPGYARQRPVLTPIVAPRGVESLGVGIGQVQSLRYRLLDFQVFQANQAKSFFEKKTQVLAQTDQYVRLSGTGSVGATVDEFFGSVSALAVSPLDFTLRRAVLSSGDHLARSLRTAFTGVATQRVDLDADVRSTVAHINTLIERIAELAKVQGPVNTTRPSASVETNLNQALDELSGLIDFSLLYQSDGTLSVVSGGGVPLVVGPTFRPLSVIGGPQQITIVDTGGRDVTAGLQSQKGELSSILEARNVILPQFLSDLNRLAKSLADRVNEQLARGVDLNGVPGKPLFLYVESAVAGAGRAPGTNGASTAAPPDSVTVTFNNGVSGAITANLESFFVASAPPTASSAGDTVSVTFSSADRSIARTITTAPLLGGETAAGIATRLNDQIALDPALAGNISFSDPGNGRLKVVLTDTARQGFILTAATSDPAFTTGLEGGGTLGGQSAEEIAAALNAQLALNPALVSAGVRFSAVGGEIKIDADVLFDFTVTEAPGATTDAFGAPDVTGFASGLPPAGTAGGAQAAFTLTLANLSPAEIAAGTSADPDGNDNIAALATLVNTPVLSGVKFSEFYAQIVVAIGEEGADAAAQLETREQILITAQNLRDSLSGVDVNEEAVRLLQFEQSFQAMLRVVQVVDGLVNEILRLVD